MDASGGVEASSPSLVLGRPGTLFAWMLALLLTRALTPTPAWAAGLSCDEAGIDAALALGGGPHSFACGGPTTVVTRATKTVAVDVILNGRGDLTISGGRAHMVFAVEPGVSVELRNLEITDGVGPLPAGIYNRGTLTLTNCVVSASHDGRARSLDFVAGPDLPGVILNDGTLTLANSAGFVLAVAAEESARSAATPLREGQLRAAAQRIQRACLQAYPPALLEELAGETRITPEVERFPQLQPFFLQKSAEREKGLFHPVPLEELLSPFQRHVGPGMRFLDLGSGDGRVVLLANTLGAHAVGIEYDATLVEVSQRAQQSLGDLLAPERLSIVQGDFFEHPWSGYQVVYYYDLGSFEPERLRRKLRAELGPQSLLIVARLREPFEGFETVARYGNVTVLRRSGPVEAGSTKP